MTFINIGWSQWSVGFVNTTRTSGEDKALGIQWSYLFPRGIIRYQLTVYLALTYSAGD
jgi:hypothetical protein